MKSNVAELQILSISTDMRIVLILVSFFLFFSLSSNAADAIQSVMLDDCNQYEELCLGIDNAEFAGYDVRVNGKAYNGEYRSCNYDVQGNLAIGNGVSIRLGVGEYVIETVNKTTGEKITKEISISCMESKNIAVAKDWIGDSRLGNVIIELDEIEIANYELLVNGEVVTDNLKPNAEKNITVFKLSSLQGKKFFVSEWNFEGKEITAAFNSGNELAALMNKMSSSTWTWDESRGVLFGGTEDMDYDAMLISAFGDEGNVMSFSPASIDIVGNMSLDLPSGSHTVQVKNFTTGSIQTKEVVISKAIASK